MDFMKRAFLLVFLIASLLLAACGEANEPATTTDPGVAEGGAETTAALGGEEATAMAAPGDPDATAATGGAEATTAATDTAATGGDAGTTATTAAGGPEGLVEAMAKVETASPP